MAEAKKSREQQLEKIEAALKSAPNNPKLLFAAGILHLELGNLGKGAAYIEDFLLQNPQHAEAHNLLGAIYYENGQLEKAETHYTQAVSLEPSSGNFWNNLGVIRLHQNSLEKALEAFQKALSLAKKDALIQSNLGVTLTRLGRDDEAHAAFTRAIKLDPGEITAHYYLGSGSERHNQFQVGELVKVGELVRIYPAVQLKFKDYSHLYSSRIEDVDDETITIAAPMRRGMPIPFHRGANLLIGIPKHDALYGFHSEIVERRGGEVPLLKLRRQPRTKRIQRRTYVRILGNISVSLKILRRKEGSSLPREIKSHELREKNISAGGLLLVLDKAIPRGTPVLVSLKLPEAFLALTGQVTRSRSDEEKSNLFEVGIKFTNIGPRDRDRVVHFVNQRMVEFRKKGLIGSA